MRFREAYSPDKFAISFELFPPKTAAGEAEMFRHVEELVRFEPSYVTCTYGAGGSTRDKTLGIVEQVRRQFGLSVAAHLTCVGASVDQLRNYLAEAKLRGIENIVALRGDPPQGETSFRPVADGLKHANELVELIRRESPELGIAVAGYPETHIEAQSPEIDLDNLCRKVQAGAEIIITQLFYDNDDYFRFREACELRGIDVPIVPGVLPVTNFAQIKRITSLCGAKLPASFLTALEARADDVEAQFRIGVDYATRQVQGLVDAGAPGVHFYVLNKSPATCSVLRGISLPNRG